MTTFKILFAENTIKIQNNKCPKSVRRKKYSWFFRLEVSCAKRHQCERARLRWMDGTSCSCRQRTRWHRWGIVERRSQCEHSGWPWISQKLDLHSLLKSVHFIHIKKLVVPAVAFELFHVYFVQTDSGLTPLYEATRSNRVEVVKFLLAAGAEIENSKGTSCLFLAAELGHKQVFNYTAGTGKQNSTTENRWKKLELCFRLLSCFSRMVAISTRQKRKGQHCFTLQLRKVQKLVLTWSRCVLTWVGVDNLCPPIGARGAWTSYFQERNQLGQENVDVVSQPCSTEILLFSESLPFRSILDSFLCWNLWPWHDAEADATSTEITAYTSLIPGFFSWHLQRTRVLAEFMCCSWPPAPSGSFHLRWSNQIRLKVLSGTILNEPDSTHSDSVTTQNSHWTDNCWVEVLSALKRLPSIFPFFFWQLPRWHPSSSEKFFKKKKIISLKSPVVLLVSKSRPKNDRNLWASEPGT